MLLVIFFLVYQMKKITYISEKCLRIYKETELSKKFMKLRVVQSQNKHDCENQR